MTGILLMIAVLCHLASGAEFSFTHPQIGLCLFDDSYGQDSVCPADTPVHSELPIMRFGRTVKVGYLPSRSRTLESDAEKAGYNKTAKCRPLRVSQSTCDKQCVFGMNQTRTCKGSQEFCRGRICSDARNPDCDCCMTWIKVTKEFLVMDTWMLADREEQIDVGLRSNSPLRHSGHVHTMSEGAVSDEASCIQSFDDQTLSMTCDSIITAVVKKGGWNTVVFVNGQRTLYNLPGKELELSDYLYIEYYLAGRLVQSEKLWVQGSAPCRVEDCVFCWNMFETFSCQSPSRRSLFMGAAVLSLLSVLSTCWILVAYGWIICSSFVCIVKCSRKMCRCMKAKAEKGYVDAKRKLNELTDDKEGEQEALVQPARPRRQEGRLTSFAIAMMMLILVASPSDACTRGVVIPTSVSSCSNDGSSQTCEIEFAATIALGAPGYTACLNFVDPVTETAMAYIEVSYDGLTALVPTNLVYYTSDWELLGNSQHNCYKSGACDGNNCASIARDDPNPHYRFGGTITERPGWTGCRPSCECAACGCFYCVSSCVWERYAFNPTGDVHQVKQISGTSIVDPAISVRYKSASGDNLLNSGYWKPSEPKFAGDFTSSLVLVGSSFSPPFSTQGLVQNLITGEATIREMSQPNSPQKGLVGEIQSGTIEGITEPSVGSFTFDDNIVSFQRSDYSTNYVYEAPSLRQPPRMRVPGIYDGSLWFMDGQDLKANVSSGSILFSISTNKAIKLIRKVNTVCPVATLVGASGCSSCSEGFRIVVKARSTCFEGTVYLKTDSSSITLSSQVLNLKKEEQDLSIDGMTSVVNNKFALTMISDGLSATVFVEFQAPARNLISNDTYITLKTSGQNNLSQSWSFWDDLANFFVGVYDTVFGGSLVSAILVIFAIACAVFIFVVLYKRVRGSCAKKERKD